MAPVQACTYLLVAFFLLSQLREGVEADLTIGRDFVFAFPCFNLNSIPSLIIVNSNENQAQLTINSSVSGFTVMQRTVQSNSALQINFTDTTIVQGMRVCPGNNGRPMKQGFRLQSSAPVALYVYIADEDGSGAIQFLIVPTIMLGSQYVRLSESAGSLYENTAIAVALEDNTILAYAGNTLTLNRLDVVLNSGNNYYGNTLGSANVPFALIGTTSTQSTIMYLPNTVVSTFSLIPPDARLHPFDVQICAFEIGTKVSVNGGNSLDVSVVGSGGRSLIVSSNGTSISVNATKPVQVYRINPSLEYSYAPENFLSAGIQFYLLGSDMYYPTVTIIVPLQSTGNILLDGQRIHTLQYIRIPYTKYYYYRQRIMGPTMMHFISTMSSDDRYMAEVYYRGSFQKYTVAMNLPFGEKSEMVTQ